MTFYGILSKDRQHNHAFYRQAKESSLTETEKKAPISVIRVRNLYKIYRVGETKVRALNGVDFEIY